MKPFILKTPPGPRAKKIIAEDEKLIPPSTKALPLVFNKAKGSNVWDVDGNRFLDWTTEIGVNSIGHSNQAVIKAVTDQVNKAMHAAFYDFYAELPLTFAKEILSTIKGYDQVFFSNSGTESVEAAMKLCRYHTKRKYFLAFFNAFHGRTYGSLSLTAAKKVHREGFGPFLPVVHVPYPNPYRNPFEETREDIVNGCMTYMENFVFKDEVPADEIAGVFVEPIQGEGGVIVPPDNFLKELSKLCKRNGILLVTDEVQTGVFRTGEFTASELFDVKPDVFCLAKAIGGGLPLGATISTKKIFNWEKGSHASTFGGNLVSCAAGLETLKNIKRNKLGNKVKKDGERILDFLKDLQEETEIIGDVRGKGLMIGMELVKDRKTKEPAVKESEEIIRKAFEKGLVLLEAGDSVVRLLPPFTLTKEEIDVGLEIIRDSFKELKD